MALDHGSEPICSDGRGLVTEHRLILSMEVVLNTGEEGGAIREERHGAAS